MGATKRDIHKKARDYDGTYPYEVEGIAALLSDINKLGESQWYRGDIDATILIVDLKQALDSNCLTPRMRQVLALYYFAQLTEKEVSDILGMQQPNVNKAMMAALERISTYMEYGYSKPNNARIDAKITPSHPFLVWVNSVADGSTPIYSIDESLTHWLASMGDKKAQETIKQKVEGYTYIPVYDDGYDEYPPYTDDQFRWKDRRVSYVGDMKYDDSQIKVGFKKTAIIMEDDEWVYPRQRLFAKRN